MLAERKAGNKMKRKWDWGSAAMSAMMLLMGMALGFTVIADLNKRGEQKLGSASVLGDVAGHGGGFGALRPAHSARGRTSGLRTGDRLSLRVVPHRQLDAPARGMGKLRVRKFTLAARTGGQCLAGTAALNGWENAMRFVQSGRPAGESDYRIALCAGDALLPGELATVGIASVVRHCGDRHGVDEWHPVAGAASTTTAQMPFHWAKTRRRSVRCGGS